MKIGIFTRGTSVRSKNIFTDIYRYPTGKHEIKYIIALIYTFFSVEFSESEQLPLFSPLSTKAKAEMNGVAINCEKSMFLFKDIY